MGWHDRKITPPPLPHYVFRDAPVEVIACVGMHPVPVYLLESEVFQGWGVARQVSLLPIHVLLLRLCVYSSPSPCLAGFHTGRGGVGLRPVLSHPPCVRPCLPPLWLTTPPSYLSCPLLILRLSQLCLILSFSGLGRYGGALTHVLACRVGAFSLMALASRGLAS